MLPRYYLGNREQARDLLERYLARQPDHPRALRLHGALLMSQGEYQEAYRLLDAAVGASSNNASLLALAGSAAMLSGAGKAGTEYLRRAAELRPDDAELARLAAAAELDSGDRDTGLAALEQIAQTSAEQPAIELAVLRERLRRGDFEQTAAAAQRFQQRYPDRPDGWALGGIALVRSGQLDAARTAFEKALAISPGYADAVIGLAEVALSAGDADAARASMAQALEQQPGDVSLLITLANLEHVFWSRSAASSRMREALEADPENTRLGVALADLYTRDGDPLSAIELLAEAPESTGYRLLKASGRAQLRAGRTSAALASFERLADFYPDSIEAHLLLAAASERAADTSRAQASYASALRLESDNSWARIGLTRAELLGIAFPPEPRRLQQPIAEVAQLMRDYPDNPLLWQLRALVAIALGRWQEAVALAQQFHQVAGNDVSALLLADAQRLNGDAVAERSTLETYLRQYPRDVRVRRSLADRLLRTEDYLDAAIQLAEIAALEPDSDEIAEKLSKARNMAHGGD